MPNRILSLAASRVARGIVSLTAISLFALGGTNALYGAPPELATSGNKVIYKSTGFVVRLVGVNIPSLEWGMGEHLNTSIPEAINNWKCNVVRLPVSQSLWLAANSATYKATVDGVIAQISAANRYVILDNHSYGQPTSSTTAFWADAANRYKNNPAVLFGVFNEAYSMTWDVWRNGDATHPGMQTLVNTIRGTGANNIAVVGGLDHAYQIQGVIDAATASPSVYALTASGNGIIYDTHLYPWKIYWAQTVGTVANLYPVLVGEIGHPGQTTFPGIPNSFEADATWVPKAMDFLDSLNLNWTGWAMFANAEPPGMPSLIADWNYTPTAWWGTPAKARLLSYQNLLAPHVIGGTVITGTADVSSRFVTNRGAVMAFGAQGFPFQSQVASGGWVGLNLGSPFQITRIDYMPFINSGAKMVGGVFEASNSPTFSSGVATLATITTAPTDTSYVFTTATVLNSSKYVYVRYRGPNGQYCRVDELKFYGRK